MNGRVRLHIIKRKVLFAMSFFLRRMKVLTREETINYILDNKCSLSRLGNGEMDIILGDNKRFQKYDPALAYRLKSLKTTNNFLLCVPSILENKNDFYKYKNDFFIKYRKDTLFFWRKYYNNNNILGDACFTRYYFDYVDHSDVPSYMLLLKKIWDKRDIVLVEGKYSRLGVGNDLFDNALSIGRVLCPPENAYDSISKINDYIIKNISKETLLLVALGPTATILCYDLSKYGYQAIDVGHIDVEYEWYRMGAKSKVHIEGKYINEADGAPIINKKVKDNAYYSQIITIID